MGELVHAMLLVLGAWLAVVLLCSGLGLLLRRACGLQVQGLEACLESFWLGWALVVLCLQIWHLFLPIGAGAWAVLAAGSACGWAWNAAAFRRFKPGESPWGWPILAAWLVFCALLANRAIGPPENVDAGIYYLNAIRWNVQYPVVPGLGNLHSFLALNSSHFLYAALLDAGPFAYRSAHAANGVFMAVLVAQILLSAGRLLSPAGEARPLDLFLVLLLPLALRWADSRFWISSPAPDLPVFVLGIVCAARLLDLLALPADDTRGLDGALVACGLLLTLGVTLKLSFAVFTAAGVALSVGVWWRRRRRGGGSPFRKVLLPLGLGMGLLVLPWMARGVYLSGYPLYPSTLGGLPVAWRMPEALAQGIQESIVHWARQPGVEAAQRLPGWGWLGPWSHLVLEKKIFEVDLPLVLCAGACLAAAGWRIATAGSMRGLRAPWSFLLVPLASLVFWFLTAPDTRFAGASFWVLGAGALVLALQECELLTSAGLQRTVLAAALILVLWPVKYFPWKKWNGPGEDAGFHPPPPPGCFMRARGEGAGGAGVPGPSADRRKPHLKEAVTRSGLKVFVPAEGGQCWEAPLPCSPGIDPRLRLRREGDLSQGFLATPP